MNLINHPMVRCIGLVVLLHLVFSSCFKEKFVSDGDAQIQFSTDTLLFDTVFTSVGSATRFFKIVNPFDLPIKINRISLQGGSQSRFIFNVDGVSYPSGVAEDIEIWANDSIYVFVEVTINPDQPLSESPFVISEQIIVDVNGQQQSLLIEAWGQNANYIPSDKKPGSTRLYTCDLGSWVWDDPKPYVIYGLLAIDSCDLVIPAGTQVYFHGGIANNDLGVYNDGLLLILPKAKIITQGTLEKPVVFQADRLEESFQDISGQWAGIRIGAGSKGNQMIHTEIKNSLVGLRVDSAASLQLDHCQIYQTASSGIIATRATINATNCLLHSNGGLGVLLRYGGTYNFNFVTIANYGNGSEALYMDNFICRDEDCANGDVFRMIANLRNCIITGSGTDEINIVDATQGQNQFAMEYAFRNCIVRVDELLDDDRQPNFFNKCSDCIENKAFDDILFENIDENDYRLDSLSIAEMQARPLPGVDTDLSENPRDPVSPDIGCFEYQ